MSEKAIVLTMYGKGDLITDISVGLFDKASSYSGGDTNAKHFCDNINELELKNNEWIYSSIIEENKKIVLKKPINEKINILNSLDDRALQKLLRDIDTQTWAKALKNSDDEIKDRILKNMSKNASKILQEDMEFIGPIKHSDIKSAQQEIIALVNKLESSGDIMVARRS
jgi:flagellar motor switch protein FliG